MNKLSNSIAMASLIAVSFVLPSFAAKPAAKAAPSVTGTYERKDKYSPGTLYVVALPNNKIQFNIGALYCSGPEDMKNGNVHTGGADGTIPIKNNVAKYVFNEYGSKYTLTFTFSGKNAGVDYEGDGFGGINVEPSGNYVKTSSKQPTKDQMATEH